MLFSRTFCTAGLLIGVLSDISLSAQRLKVSVSPTARSLQPGEVVLLDVIVSHPVVSVEGNGPGGAVDFFELTGETRWQGLMALPLNLKPGSVRVAVKATASEGWVGSASRVVRVRPRVFGVRRLLVPEEFVTPPESERERIALEAQLVGQILSSRSPDRLWRGAFVLPVGGTPTSSFGRYSILNGRYRTRHTGADFAAETGDPIIAPNSGVVELVADLYFLGKTVILDHGWGLHSVFGHLSRADVSDGQKVQRGDTIGLVGATGRVTGPHLHWAVRLGRASVDPLSLVHALSEAHE